jgi:putative transposase
MKTIIQKVGYDYDIDIVELEIPEDHIHMVIRGIPKQPPSDVMRVIKSITARKFFRIYPEIKRNISGAVNCGLKASLLKPLVMRRKR